MRKICFLLGLAAIVGPVHGETLPGVDALKDQAKALIKSEGQKAWEGLLEKGDEASLKKARQMVMALGGQEAIDSLISLMEKGVDGVADFAIAKATEAVPLDRMKIAYQARRQQDPKFIPLLLQWARTGEDPLLQEVAIRSLGYIGNESTKAALEAMKSGELPPFVTQAIDAASSMLSPAESDA